MSDIKQGGAGINPDNSPGADLIVNTRYKVSGMDCASCAAKIDTAARRVPGVRDVNVSVVAGSLNVEHDGDLVEVALFKQITSLGYGITRPQSTATPKQTAHAYDDGCCAGHDDHDHAGSHDRIGADLHGHADEDSNVPWWKTRKALLTIACGLALLLAYVVGKIAPNVEQFAFVAALAVGLVPIASRAFAAARAGSPFTIETLMTIAAVGALIIGAVEEAATVVLLFLVGELLEGVAAGRARSSIRSLTKLVPSIAFLEDSSGASREVPADTLVVGSIIMVRPGDRIPADGVVISGEGLVDEAPVTGESMPKRRRLNDAVFAGTVNLDNVLRIRVTAAAQDNTIARIVRLVEEAQESKAPTERFIDRFARYYTPAVIVVAGLVAVLPPLLMSAAWSDWVYKGLAVLLIGCPCALVISTPAAIASGLSAGARRGLLIKGGAVLEQLGQITIAAFDKTGTLTEGRPVVTDIVAFAKSERDVLSLAAALEGGSSHPLARAILAKAAEAGAPVPPAADVAAIAGKGLVGRVGGAELFLGSAQAASDRTTINAAQSDAIERLQAQGKTVSVLLSGTDVAGVIAMRDEPRPDAKAGVDALRRAGITSVMVTGDNRQTARSIAEMLGIEPRAELMPEDKQRIVHELQAKGEIVAKIGDGINDAPGLAAANVGIAMGGGTDVALETADAAVLHGRVLDVAHMVALSRSVMATIRQNVAISLGLKAVFLVTTIVGLTGLWPAILADTGATVLVTLNALRLLDIRFEN